MIDIEINGEIGTDTAVTGLSNCDVQVMVNNYEGTATAHHTPAQARELAAALLRAADEAEGVESVEAATTSTASKATRFLVAAELAALPILAHNDDGTAYVGYRQAIGTARNGLHH
ncbi:hypothetical protein ACIQUY_05040 [Streptomyces sp. NPDC090231]|uniref:hypothetical protein n=1 Tax=unclassified Streptomyces TaxID=2593676 RepID=UPI0037FC413D